MRREVAVGLVAAGVAAAGLGVGIGYEAAADRPAPDVEVTTRFASALVPMPAAVGGVRAQSGPSGSDDPSGPSGPSRPSGPDNEVIPTPHCDGVPPSGFVDIAGNTHEHSIDCIAAAYITTGGPGGRPANEYGPELPNTRGQIMTFIVRMLNVAGYSESLPYPSQDWYDDDNGTTHEFATNILAEMGVTDTSTRTFRHADGVRRDEMAEFLGRAFAEATGTTPDPGPNAFSDDDGNPAEPWINVLANAGVVQGDEQGNYVPANIVHRDQMASFIARETAWLLASA